MKNKIGYYQSINNKGINKLTRHLVSIFGKPLNTYQNCLIKSKS